MEKIVAYKKRFFKSSMKKTYICCNIFKENFGFYFGLVIALYFKFYFFIVTTTFLRKFFVKGAMIPFISFKINLVNFATAIMDMQCCSGRRNCIHKH